MKNNSLIKTEYSKLRGIVFDYFFTGLVLTILGLVVFLVMFFCLESDDPTRTYRTIIPASLLALLAFCFFILAFKYAVIYFPLKKDIKLSRKNETEISIDRFKLLKQIIGRNLSYVTGIKIITTENGKRVKYYLFFNSQTKVFYDRSMKKVDLQTLKMQIVFFEKSHCIYTSDKYDNIISKLKSWRY